MKNIIFYFSDQQRWDTFNETSIAKEKQYLTTDVADTDISEVPMFLSLPLTAIRDMSSMKKEIA